MFPVLFSIFLFSSIFPFSTCECDLKKFEGAIVPAIVPEPPKQELEVVYNNKTRVTCGQNLTVAETKNKPIVKYEAADSDLHTLVMIDPDAPDPDNPRYAHFLHWLVVNIRGNQVDKGETKVEYMGPSPPDYSSAHRYIFLAFRQREYFNDSTYMNDKRRILFSVDEMTKKLKLTELIAGNLFYTRSSKSKH